MTMPLGRAAGATANNYRAMSHYETNNREEWAQHKYSLLGRNTPSLKPMVLSLAKNANRLCRISPLCIVIIISPQQLRLKICCDSYCEAFKCKQQSLWAEATATHRRWICDRYKVRNSASDGMRYLVMDKLSGAYIAPCRGRQEYVKIKLIP